MRLKKVIVMKKYVYLMLATLCGWCYQFTSALGFNSTYIKPELNDKMNAFKDEFSITINGLMGFFLASSVLIMIIHFIRLGQHGDKPHLRMKVMNDLIITGICTAAIGSAWFIYGLVMLIAIG